MKRLDDYNYIVNALLARMAAPGNVPGNLLIRRRAWVLLDNTLPQSRSYRRALVGLRGAPSTKEPRS